MNKHLKSYRKYYEFTVKWLDNLINNKIDLTPYKINALPYLARDILANCS